MPASRCPRGGCGGNGGGPEGLIDDLRGGGGGIEMPLRSEGGGGRVGSLGDIAARSLTSRSGPGCPELPLRSDTLGLKSQPH